MARRGLGYREVEEGRWGETMIRLKCFSCGLTVAYKGSDGDICPRCLCRDQQAVQLIAVSDETSPDTIRSMGRMTIYTVERDDSHVIALSGELDVASAQLLDAALADACAGGAKEVVLDLAGIDFMDSTGLNAILRGRTLCEERLCEYRLTPAQRPVRRVFEIADAFKRLPFRKAG